MKRLLILLVIGGFVGSILSAWLAPGLIGWWAAPPVQNSMMTCNKEVQWAMGELVKAQLGCAVGGAILFGIGGVVAQRALRNRAARKAAAAPVPKAKA